MDMIPGMGNITKQLNMGEGDREKQLGGMRAIYDSMTPRERKNPDVLDSARRRRVARGAGVNLNEVGQFMKQFESARGMMRAFGGQNMGGKMKMLGAMMGGKLNNMGMPGGPSLRTKKSGFMEKKDRNKKKKR
jgi:signal recognition particle subunit SRP54